MNIRTVVHCAIGTLVGATLAGCPSQPIQSTVEPPTPPPFDGGPQPFPDVDGGFRAFTPQFGTTTTSRDAPPPVTGGTMAVMAGDIVVVADPDRDTISVVDVSSVGVTPGTPLDARRIRGTIALPAGSEPGRVTAGPDGVAYVALRRGGSVVSIDVGTATITEQRSVCAAPRGVAFDGTRLFVACNDGDLFTLPATGGTPTLFYHAADGDLRDVIPQGDRVFVTRFRTADVIVLDATGHERQVVGPTQFTHTEGRFAGALFQPGVAWRAVAFPGGGIGVVHQRALLTEPGNQPVQTESGGYGAPVQSAAECGNSIVHGTISVITDTNVTPVSLGEIPSAVLPVDMAVSPTGDRIVMVATGNSFINGAPTVIELAVPERTMQGGSGVGCEPTISRFSAVGEPTAIVLLSNGRAVVQSREPAVLTVENTGQISLSTDSRFDTGHAVFHSNSGGGLACAGCHPEGGDDGRVWIFDGEGLRRTQNLRGGLLGTEPFHWGGDQSTFAHLANDVFVGRMSGLPLASEQVNALARWIDHIPTLPQPPMADVSAVERGNTLFHSPELGCASCHSGSKFTNNATVNVGTGGALQVPALMGLRFRAPFMHTGCAATLRDRFSHPECGGGDQHGHTSQLAATQIDDLVAYLQTL